MQLVLDHGAPGEIYNIGAGNETPNRVLVDKLLALFGAGEESVEYVTDRLGHDRRYSVDIAKITALGWQRQRTLDEALEETVAWYRDNRWWWEPLKQRALNGMDAFTTVGVVVVNYNGGDLTLDCLRSLLAPPGRPRSCASCSSTTRPTTAWPRGCAASCPVVRGRRTRRRTTASAPRCNVGIARLGDVDAVALVNNDATVEPGWLAPAGARARCGAEGRRRVPEDPARGPLPRGHPALLDGA